MSPFYNKLIWSYSLALVLERRLSENEDNSRKRKIVEINIMIYRQHGEQEVHSYNCKSKQCCTVEKSNFAHISRCFSVFSCKLTSHFQKYFYSHGFFVSSVTNPEVVLTIMQQSSAQKCSTWRLKNDGSYMVTEWMCFNQFI